MSDRLLNGCTLCLCNITYPHKFDFLALRSLTFKLPSAIEFSDATRVPDMASTPKSQGLSDRLLQIIQTLQFAWFAGHVVLLLSSLRYSISFLTFSQSTMTKLSYRSTFFSAAVTYGIVVFKAYKSRTRSGRKVRAGDMIWDENVQYFSKALLT